MAKSTAQSHATLIREMARETSRSSRSSQHSRVSASPQPTLSDFDPENEAIMSTQQLDNNAQHLPALRASAQKYNRFSRPSRLDPPIQSEPDYAINTSAIGRAFPDFSQGGTSSDEGGISIEIGRGGKKTNDGPISKLGLSKEYSSNAQLDFGENSLDFAAPMVGDYVVTATPPLPKHRSSRKITETARDLQRDGQGRGQSKLRRELSRTASPISKTKDYGSSESRKGSGEHGATLAAIHARVRDEFDVSQIEDDRPPTIDLTARNTRFASSKHQPQTSHALPTKFSSTQGLMTQSSLDRQNGSHKTTNAGTQQSFLLPEMPNMSELISGVFEDGTPVFPRHSKSRSSRFAKEPHHTDVAEIPVPEDEQAIFLSLKLLQDRIAVLERNQGENEVVIHELEQKNQALESERAQQKRRVSHRSDSALGASESDGEERKLTIERNRLESSIRLLQHELDTSNRKVTTAETILRKITQERDSAVSQLSVAYITIKQLEAENEDLKEENRVLRGPTQQTTGGTENTGKVSGKTNDIENDDTTAAYGLNRHRSPSKSTRFAKRSHRHNNGATAKSAPDSDMFDLTPRPQIAVEDSGARNFQKNGVDFEESEASIDEEPQIKVSNKAAAKRRSSRAGRAHNEDSTRDLTYLSFLDSNEVAKLRKTLEQEHIERKQRLDSKQHSSKSAGFNEQQSPHYSHESQRDLPRKSSLKDLTSRSMNNNDKPAATNEERDLERRHSEPSLLSTRSRRHGMNLDNMTSAFIVPDITIRAISGKPQGNPEASKETTTIPKPIPVSERVPITGPYEEEPTIRPSQAPGLALATVIKGLEDEISRLKVQLAKYQALYNGHDPALSKRKRKSVQTKIEFLLQAIDVKSDQIYALYDVLEGQKQDNQEMSEEEVEITLQSVGIDPAKLHFRGGGEAEAGETKGKNPERRPWDLSSDDEDDDLPWEGIESTVETTKNSSARNKRRSAAV